MLILSVRLLSHLTLNVIPDAEKAFDTFNHDIMFSKLYQDGVEGDMWSLMNNMYKGMTFKVKWDNNLTDNINIAQGIRQVRNGRPSLPHHPDKVC
jgi:hypothetical protein